MKLNRLLNSIIKTFVILLLVVSGFILIAAGVEIVPRIGEFLDGMLTVISLGKNGTSNSTTIPLEADAVFTGEWDTTKDYNSIIITVTTDKASATDGLMVEWSDDGINKVQDDVFTISANTGKVFTFAPAGHYMRLVYTNGDTTQTSFSLHAMMKQGGILGSSHRIQDSIIDEDDAELVKSVLTGITDEGVFINIKAAEPGDLRTVAKPWPWAVALNEIQGIQRISKFGRNANITNSTEDIWSGSTLYTYLTSGSMLWISSSDTDDDQDIEVQGLDENYVAMMDTVTLLGQAAVEISDSWIRVFRMRNIGTTDNAGTIEAYSDSTGITGGNLGAGDADIKARIEIGENQTTMALWTVPAGKTAFLIGFDTSAAGQKSTTVELFIREFGGVFQLKKPTNIFANPSSVPYIFPLVIPEKSDITIRGATAATGADVTAGFELFYVDN